jgi:hypothetical protein
MVRSAASALGRRPTFISFSGALNAPMTKLIHESLMRHAPGRQKGAMGYVLAWLLGVPIPILILVALLRGCS